jgi:hypothetical protein
MTVSGISNGLSTIGSSTQGVHNNLRQFQQEFQQLGSDLQSGNQTAAQQDYATLHSLAGEGGNSSVSTGLTSNNPLVQQFNQLGEDLVSGNVSGAEQTYGNLKQNFQNIDKEHNNHQSPVQDPGPGQASPASPAVPSTDLSSVQTAYASLLQGLQEFGSESLTPSLLSSTSLSI